MRILYFDTETYSAVDLTKIGSYLYAQHATTDIRCVSFCLVIDGVRGPIKVWQQGDPVPQEFIDIADDPDAWTVTFNDAFDRQIQEQILVRRYGWPTVPLERRRCAQAAVLSRALPASLDATAAALGITTRKSKAGIAIMKRLARPRRQSTKERKAGKPLDFSATPEELATLIDYAKDDTLMTMEIVDRIGLLPPSEQAIWELDQLINERGVYVDVPLIETAISVGGEAKLELYARMTELTGEAVTRPAQTQRILRWLEEHNCKLPNIQKSTVADALLEPGLNLKARQLLELRQSSGGAAALKFATLRRWVDGQSEPRIRYAYRYHGGSAGRFTSLGCQLHNLRKPEIDDIPGAIAAVATGSIPEMRRRGFARPLETVEHITRAAIRAKPGHRLFIADLSGIEARGAAHVCGARNELEQWRKFDRSGRPEDEPYYLTGLSTFAQSPATARKAGKTGSLAFQYQGGIGAYRRVTGDVTLAEEIVVARRDAWRADHPSYVQFWRLSVFQAVQAIRNSGMEFTANVITFKYDRATGFLEMWLPSGRCLTYPKTELLEDEQYGTTSFTFLDASGSKTGRMYHERRGSGAFGGLILENAVQALCRDIFVEAMPRLEAAGYPIVMHTHDDFVCEVPDGQGSLEEFLTIITQSPDWAPDLPIAAKARISDRFIEIPEPRQTEAIITNNTIDNAVAELEDEDEEDLEEELPESKLELPMSELELPPVSESPPPPPPSMPPPPPPLELHVCAQCHLDPPDGSERVSSYNDIYLHERCEDAFIQARMAEEGLPWSSLPDPSPSPPPSSPPSPPPQSNGRGNGLDDDDGFDLAALLGPQPSPRGNGQGGDGYPHGEDRGPAAGPATAEYIYRTAENRLHMRVVRTAAKQFPTYHWHNGDWVAGWPDEVVPYRLPEMLAAPPDVTVLICEGEKNADAAARYGFVATTNPGGAGKWQPELSNHFKGKQRVVILEDNDAAGTKHTAKVSAALHGIVPAIGVVAFPELGPGGDLSDYFERGGSKPYLVTRIEEALQRGIALNYTLIDLDKDPPEADDWLWEGHLPAGALELTTGIPGVGKSLLQCDLIAIVTTGRNWPDGTSGPQPGRVIILTAEDRVADVKRRLIAAGADLRLTHVFGDIKRNERNEQFLLAQDLDKLEHAVNSKGDVRFVTIDPITAYMGSGRGFDSHRATDVRSQLLPLSKLAEKLNTAFSAITHPPKNATARAAIDSFIGSQAFIAAARVGHYCIAELGEEDDRSRRRPTGRILFTTVKGSHSAAMPTLAYRIEVVRIDWDAKRQRDIIVPRIVWEQEPVDVTADEAIAANKATFGDSRKARAAPIREFLRDILIAAGAPVLQKIIIERGALKNYSLDQLRRARRAIGAIAFKRQGENLSSPWLWAMPEHVPPDVEKEEP
jgi:DNA polymerase bacteriophage-type